MAVDVAQGAQFTAQSSGLEMFNVTEITWSGWSREVIETTHLGTTTSRTYRPDDLYNPGEVNLEIQFDPALTTDIGRAMTVTSETITIDWNGGADNWTAAGFISNFDGPVSSDAALVTGTITFKLTGDIGEVV